MNHSEWDGQVLGSSRLALVVWPTKVDLGAEIRPIIVAVANEASAWVLPPERIGDFLRSHSQEILACVGVGMVSQVITRRLRHGDDHEALRAFWTCSREYRLEDVVILDQLVELATHGVESRPRSLSEIARQYCRLTISDWPDDVARIENMPWEQVRCRLGPVAIEQARATYQVHTTLRRQANELVEQYDEPSALGPLSLGVQVQGAIALDLVTNARRLIIRRDVREALRKRNHEVYQTCSTSLQGNPAARKCFRWDDAEVARDSKGCPKDNRNQLRRWLSRIAEQSRDVLDLPIDPPRTSLERIATSAAAWTERDWIDPLVEAWVQLDTAAAVLRRLEDPDPSLMPLYESLPRLTSRNPNLEQVRRIYPGPIFEAPSGFRFAIGKLRDLELRCIADRSEDVRSGGKLAGLFRDGIDPVDYAAAAPSHRRLFHEDGDCISAFEMLKQSDPCISFGWKVIAQTFLWAIPRRVPNLQILQLLRGRLDDELYLSDIDRRRVFFHNVLFPELAVFGRDPAPVRLLRTIEAPDHQAIDHLYRSKKHPRYAIRLRNLLSGQTVDGGLRAELEDLCVAPEWRDRLTANRLGSEVHDVVVLESVPTGVGRFRSRLDCREHGAAICLDLADDIRKVALHAVVEAGFELVGVCGDELVVLLPDNPRNGPNAVAEQTKKIASLVERAAGEFLDYVPIRCDVEVRSEW